MKDSEKELREIIYNLPDSEKKEIEKIFKEFDEHINEKPFFEKHNLTK